MVQISTIRDWNAQFTTERHTGLVCVFVGATAGIGAATLQRMAQMLNDSTFYVLGRSATKFEGRREMLQSLNASNKIVFIQTEVSLISGIDDACKQIVEEETKVDYVCMSAGKVPFEGASYTKEGLEFYFALSYCCRIRLVNNLLPLLRRSPRPRILSVLNGGKEGPLVEDDLGLERTWTISAAINQSTTMLSLTFERLSSQNPQMTFMHVYPGLVNTEIISGMTALPGAGVLNRIMLAAIRGAVAVLMLIMGIEVDDCGDRQAFHLTSDKFGPVKAWRIDEKSEEVSSPGVMTRYREGNWMERVWEFTMGVFEKALAAGNTENSS